MTIVPRLTDSPVDAVLRSSLYSHFSESLSGLATIRAYGETERFRLDNERRVDIENRSDNFNRFIPHNSFQYFSAYWLTVTNQVSLPSRPCQNRKLTNIVYYQRWLGIRLDFLGTLLTFIVAMLTVGTRFTISPAQTGLVLSYILSVQQASVSLPCQVLPSTTH